MAHAAPFRLVELRFAVSLPPKRGCAAFCPRPRTFGRMAAINPVQLQKYLSGVDYPASKSDLIQAAQREGADQNAIAVLHKLPEQRYNSPNDVSEAVGDTE